MLMYAKNKQRPKFRQKPQRLKFFTFLLSPFTIIIVQGYFSTTSLSYLPLLYNIPFLSSSSLRHPFLTFLFCTTSLSYLPLPYDIPFLASSSLQPQFLTPSACLCFCLPTYRQPVDMNSSAPSLPTTTPFLPVRLSNSVRCASSTVTVLSRL